MLFLFLCKKLESLGQKTSLARLQGPPSVESKGKGNQLREVIWKNKDLFLVGNCSLCALLCEHLGCYVEQSLTLKVESVDSLQCL